jgi:hypothetical protein
VRVESGMCWCDHLVAQDNLQSRVIEVHSVVTRQEVRVAVPMQIVRKAVLHVRLQECAQQATDADCDIVLMSCLTVERRHHRLRRLRAARTRVGIKEAPATSHAYAYASPSAASR